MSDISPQDVLTRAHDLLGEYGICRGAYALDGNGNSCSGLNQSAQRFCSVGAIGRAMTDLGVPMMGHEDLWVSSHQTLAAELKGNPPISTWNDCLATDQEILSTFRKAAGLPEPSVPVEELTEASEQVLVAV